MSTATLIEVFSIVLIVLWNAFFVAAEYSFLRIRATRLQELVDSGSKRARRVQRILDDRTEFISAIQLAVTISSLALGAVGEPAFARLVQDLFGLGGAARQGLAYTFSVALAFVILTTIHVVLGEIVPKTVGLARAETVALRVAPEVDLFMKIFHPFVWFLGEFASLVLRLLGLSEYRHLREVHSEDELKMLVASSKEVGVIQAEEQEMLYKVFDFAETEVEEVMVPRPDIVALPVTLTPEEAAEEVLKHPYTRYPVYRDDLDEIVGLLHIRRLYASLQNGGHGGASIESLVRPAYIVPETKQLGKLLGEMRRTFTHMVVVVDEYGSTAGIVTLEDVIEQIVGEIDDEFDRPDVSILRLGKDRVRVAGSFPIDEFNARFGLDLPEDDYVTVGGFVFGELGRAPVEGDVVDVPGCRFTVSSVDGARIISIDVEFKPAPPPPSTGNGGGK
jgi:CBS domain containing-hemolysin-like protein